MPTTLTGLLIFIVLLAPGFLYVIVTEQGPFTRTAPSVLRETASIALVSLLCDLVALGLYVPAAAMSGGRLASLRKLVEDGESVGAQDRVTVLTTALFLLLAACLVALTLAGLVNNTSGFDALKVRKPISWVPASQGRANRVSMVGSAAPRAPRPLPKSDVLPPGRHSGARLAQKLQSYGRRDRRPRVDPCRSDSHHLEQWRTAPHRDRLHHCERSPDPVPARRLLPEPE